SEMASQDALALGSIHLGLRVLVLNFLLAVLAGALLALLPSFHAVRADINSWVKQGSGGGGFNLQSLRRRANPLSLLVVAEIALSLVLLVGAGLVRANLRPLYLTPL